MWSRFFLADSHTQRPQQIRITTRGLPCIKPSWRFRVNTYESRLGRRDAATDDATILRLSSLVVLVVGIVGYLH